MTFAIQETINQTSVKAVDDESGAIGGVIGSAIDAAEALTKRQKEVLKLNVQSNIVSPMPLSGR